MATASRDELQTKPGVPVNLSTNQLVRPGINDEPGLQNLLTAPANGALEEAANEIWGDCRIWASLARDNDKVRLQSLLIVIVGQVLT